jgi:anti-sigma-K factor RskA
MPETAPPERRDDRVPLFGTWRAIYAAVALSALAVMALLALFSRWPF